MKHERYMQLHGATCPSCALAIEKYGRKLNGVEDIQVDSFNSRMRVNFSIEDEKDQNIALEKLIELVKRIGYNAAISG